MSVDRLDGRSPAFDVDRPGACVPVGDAASQMAGGTPPRVVVAGGRTDTVETLLLLVARGDREAFVALERRMVGLVRVNVRRVLRDASQAEAVTESIFAELLEDAVRFDPRRDSAETWLLTRAHQRAVDGPCSADGGGRPGGAFDPQARSYHDNLVVFAELVGDDELGAMGPASPDRFSHRRPDRPRVRWRIAQETTDDAKIRST